MKTLQIVTVWTVAAMTSVGIVARGDETASENNKNPQEISAPAELVGLHERLVEIMEALYIPGMAVAVVRGDEVIFMDALGVRDPASKLPVTPDTIFYIASITKTYIATAIVALAEQGKIDLDTPVRKYLPRFKVADPGYTNTLTVRDLLCHAKGLTSDEIVYQDAYTGEITEDRYYYWLGKAKPTGKHQYTNVHFTLAGRVVEAVTGVSWKDWLQESIFNPTDMTRTTCYASRMYGDENGGLPSVSKNGEFVTTDVRKTDRVMHAAGGIGASVKDLSRWIRIHLASGKLDGKRLISAKGAAEMQTLQAVGASQRGPALAREGHGLGWFVGKYRGRKILDHGGGYIGTSASVSFLPKEQIGIAVVANASGPGPDLVMSEIYDRLLRIDGDDRLAELHRNVERRLASSSRPASSTVRNPAGTNSLMLPAEAYVGRYENVHHGSIRFDVVEGKLTAALGDMRLTLKAAGQGRIGITDGGGSTNVGRFVYDKNEQPAALTIRYGPDKVRFDKR